MKKRLFALFAVAVVFLTTAICVFALPCEYPSYYKYFENDLRYYGGRPQDDYTVSEQAYASTVCAYCGQTVYYNLIVRSPRYMSAQTVYGDIFIVSSYNNRDVDRNVLATINDTSKGCVVTLGKDIISNCDVMSKGDYLYLYVHRDTMRTSASTTPLFGAVIKHDSIIGERISNNIPINIGDNASYALRLSCTSLIYDLVYYEADGNSYDEGYKYGYYNGVIRGQNDAHILGDIDGFFDGFFRGVSTFFQPILSLGVGEFTIGNFLEIILSLYLVMVVIKIIRS